MSERFCVVSTMRNEGPFVLEWVAHYKALGFDDCVVCSNDCEDATTELLLALQDRGLVRHHATLKPATGPLQFAAIKQALECSEARQASWVFVCDADEFLNIKISDGSVRALVAASEKYADALWVPWRVFGVKTAYRFRDASVKAQFLMGQERVPLEGSVRGSWGKSLHRTASSEKIEFVGVHKPNALKDSNAGFRINLPGGQPYVQNGARSSVKATYDHAQVNHYALRSLDSYLVKRARGSPANTNQIMNLEYWETFDRNGCKDVSIRRYDEGAAHWMNLFRKDAQLMELHRASVDWYERKAAELRASPELQELIIAIESRHIPSSMSSTGIANLNSGN